MKIARRRLMWHCVIVAWFVLAVLTSSSWVWEIFALANVVTWSVVVGMDIGDYTDAKRESVS